MCFSATASFTSSAILMGLGVATLKNCETKAERFLASLPCFFAIQQFSEGVVWLSFETAPPFFSFYFYLFFALIFWPIWIPLSMRMIEENPKIKKIITGFLFLGIGLGIYYVSTLIYSQPSLKIVKSHLVYDSNIYTLKYLYALIILIPFFLSSYKGIKVFGSLVLCSFLIANYFYEYAFLSVWCFCAATISLVLYKIMEIKHKDEKYEGVGAPCLEKKCKDDL